MSDLCVREYLLLKLFYSPTHIYATLGLSEVLKLICEGIVCTRETLG